MPDFLHLPHLATESVENLGDHYVVRARGAVVPTACPACHAGLYRHGSQRQCYIDTPMHGKRVIIEIDRHRFRCKACGKTLFEPPSAVDGKRLATVRLVKHLERHCLRKTFADLAREVGVDDKTIRHVFDDYIARLKCTVHFETPEVLGIDELKIVGQYRAMITNVEKLALFDMLPTRKKADLIAYFGTLPDKHRVKVLTMDLWSVYRQVAQAQFPGTMIVADRFHVVRMANDALEKVRKAIRKDLERKQRLRLKDERFVLLSRYRNLNESDRLKLAEWSEQFPALGAAYRAKEAFHDLYNFPTKAEAMKAAKEWEATLDARVAGSFREVVGALHSWWDEIFHFYDHPISNAYTESVNNLAKGMNRMGRGYSFEVIRARLLYDEEARSETKTTLRRKVRRKVATSDQAVAMKGSFSRVDLRDVGYETVEIPRQVEYGPYMPALARKLEAGEFE